ncbi:transcriptional regulator [Polymorphobacter multimanifer]|uniref:CRP-like cAMP-binding protein n=2 Tax=Polymorphobacter multimanifer TaxID=1070431 RepID=A0A841L7S3_9SPHN|nr:CRP-like cAMP-binding protein [Polymorphobacter multimanifer]GGI85719.1 transcriptional regulator [Polymorphobacter multimanifer]
MAGGPDWTGAAPAGFTAADLAHFTLFAEMPDAAANKFVGRIRMRHFSRGDTLVSFGAGGSDVFLLCDGPLLAKRFSASGQEFGYRRIPVHGYFGEIAALDGGPRSASVVALGEARVGVIAAADFRALVADHPAIAAALLADLASRVRELSDRLFAASTVSLPGRVAAEVTRMALAAGVVGDGGIVPDLPTHAELAAIVGGQRETVTRAFNRLVDAGIVARQGRSLVIRRFEALLAQTGD